MRAEIRSIFSSDVEDLAEFRPSDDSFAIAIRFIAGPAGAPGEESFDLTVCSPSWLGEQTVNTSVYDARHHLVVRGFDWAAIRGYIEGRVARCDGETWQEIGHKLSRLGHWEFEDYP
ncbi:immunity 8 family protein [Cellulomonas pakistanensis]|uniref:Immunity protein 8 of polymorphic toxin system n=1 Tax=Cellulomonas pakistanensis TaxID=992287 RepID=A0A919P8A8_9CELL|nr:immunity 8 family protein [Cellulomonas pakistanensis]GIG34835.1 hypothetical protein Cpa01nite_02160 [Cellulomonas pakistanensis]